jgi:adenylosuccinate synthase
MTSVAVRQMALLPFTSQLIADVGISLGDEGKGRLVPRSSRSCAARRAASRSC